MGGKGSTRSTLKPSCCFADRELELTEIDSKYWSREFSKSDTQRELIAWADRNNGTAMLPALFAALG